jgi:hypothetical protein
MPDIAVPEIEPELSAMRIFPPEAVTTFVYLVLLRRTPPFLLLIGGGIRNPRQWLGLYSELGGHSQTSVSPVEVHTTTQAFASRTGLPPRGSLGT